MVDGLERQDTGTKTPSGIFNFVDVHANESERDPNANGRGGAKPWRADYTNIAAPSTIQFDDSNSVSRNGSNDSALGSPFASNATGVGGQHLRPCPFSNDIASSGSKPDSDKLSRGKYSDALVPNCTLPPPEVSEPGKNGNKTQMLQLPEMVLSSGAVAGAAISAASWALDNKYAHMVDQSGAMEWWAPHSRMLKAQENLAKAVTGAEKANQAANAELGEYMRNEVFQSNKSLDTLRRSVVSELEQSTNSKKLADLIKRLRGYVETPLDIKDLPSGAHEGRIDQVLSGEKLFERRTELDLTRISKNYESTLWLGKMGPAPHWRQDMVDILDSQWSKLGTRALTSDADLNLLGKQNEFISLVENNGSMAKSQIGSAAELSKGSKLFLSGSEPAKILSSFAETMERQNSLLLTADAAKARLLLTQGALGAQIEKGAGSFLGRTLCGSGKGIVVAAGVVACGYAFEQIDKMLGERSH